MCIRDSYSVRHWLDGGDGTTAIVFNLNHKDQVLKSLFHQRNFRIAMSHAIDRDAIREAAFLGIGESRQISPPPISAYHMPEHAYGYLTYDPVLANLRAVQHKRVYPLGPSSFRIDYYSGRQMLDTVAGYFH